MSELTNWADEWKIERVEIPGRGWVAHAFRGTAQGATEDEAIANLAKLLQSMSAEGWQSGNAAVR